MLARFPLQDFEGAQVQLLSANGQPLPVGTQITHRETGKQYVVGYDGLAFVDDLSQSNTLDAAPAGKPCEVEVPYKAQGHGLPTLGPFTCGDATP
ncbi:hypothetical protein BSFA1_41830 [Burkholderia sp. SFA1]|uniref:FimD/PapC C-terminal domain-containing protein n=1 Tax=unclassified Caballeronia TaxID=2646786 RepID=UPI001F3CDE5D|nr:MULTISPECIES: FimD/PapC C-terminal domain-containing protein [unclassified Caballeronia]MCE4543884.1 hypothetical protein [Caballeronia sp. PC1]MCE4571036.1 hypothetical protein [Caballeronia sp. CLC5]BBP99054.1 hypothetical protein BSFA1_41830 [Burkholderia sp. SFA1]